MTRPVLAAGAAAAALLAAAAPAQAAFGPGATVVSASLQRKELADDASQYAALSADGRYVAFQTRASNLFADDDPDAPGTDRRGGIFRRDLQTGDLVLVASGDVVEEDDGTLITTGARNPSISADGRYVAFATGAALVPGDRNGAIDVYVRDMLVPASDPSAYTLVSVRADGTAATYAAGDQPDGQRPGADVWPLTSISADGRRVVFRTVAASDLPTPAADPAPAGQLLMRDLAAGTTRLLTRSSADGTPAGGAKGATAISADGSTVVWAGGNARAQTPFLTGESFDDLEAYYLWRRIDDPGATTRRVTGLVDLDDPACPPNGSTTLNPTSTGPCDGPLTTTDQGSSSIGGRPLAISGDGRRVVFLTPGFPRPSQLNTSTLDVYSSDMSAGVTRKAGSLELTREGAADDARAAPGIDGIALSADARWLALSTFRTRFVAGRLQLQSTARQTPDAREVYLADLAAGTAERVITSTTGGDARGGDAGSTVSVSADGGLVAFTSAASNLFFGDANNSVDAFVVDRSAPAADEATAAVIEPPNEDLAPAAAPRKPRLRISVGRTRTRQVRLTVTVPTGGKLTVRGSGRIPAAGGRKTKVRTLATGAGKAKQAAKVRIVLRPAPSARKALKRLKGLRATTVVRFVPTTGSGTLTARRSVKLLPPPKAKPKRKRKGRGVAAR